MQPRSEAVRRLPYLVALILALVALREAARLPVWDIFGAGPGLFPSLVAGILAGIAAVLVAFPGLAGEAPEAEAEDPGPPRVFWLTVAALPLLAFASAWTGFIVLSVGLSLLMVWLAERRSPWAALAFGLACGLIGVLCFAFLLRVNIPADQIDRYLLRALR